MVLRPVDRHDPHGRRMKRARYRGDVTDQFHVGKILGRLNTGGFIRCTSVDYDPDTRPNHRHRRTRCAHRPDGMRLRYHGESDDQ